MQPPARQISTCPTCGAALEETFGGGLGCMFCLLHAGIGSKEETVHDSTPDALEGGVRFGVYEIDCHADGSLCELGRGAMGVTYRATDTSLQPKVALKIIKSDIAERNADARERFVREARAAAALRHEHVATVYQFGMRLETGQYFYAMELIEGETLEDRVRRAGPLDARCTIGIAEQVTSALAAAEKHGLVHRDLKPANLMLVNPNDAEVVGNDQARSERKTRALRKSGVPVVKIIDFGLAKAFHTATDPKSLTHDRFVGTPAFASPEQFEHSALDVRSDIYSLGETLWYALTRKTPFAGRTLSEIHRAQKSDVLPIEQLKSAHIPHGLKSLLESILAFEPASRPGTGELAARLQRCSPEARTMRRTRAALSLATVFVFGLSTLFLAYRSRVENAALNPAPGKSIAVLPFKNLSPDPNNVYFADGTQNENLTKLASNYKLKVISRTSSAKYKSKPDDLKAVARELGVATVLEGSVQKAGDKIRVNVRLLDARRDTHLWANSYDGNFSDIFAVESGIAQEIADVLQAKLSPTQGNALAAAPTRDTEAYDFFLRGEYEFHEAKRSLAPAAFDHADALYRKALARDPKFAGAAAALAQNRLCRHWYVSRLTPSELKEVKSIIDRALALAPNSLEAHSALAMFFYLGQGNYENALTELHYVLKLQPNNPLARQYRGLAYRRLGEWERSLAELKRAEEFDPRNAQIAMNFGLSHLALRLWKDAERAELRALAIDPHKTDAAKFLLDIRLNGSGDVESAQRTFEGFPEDLRLSLARGEGCSKGGTVEDIVAFPVYLHVIERRFTNAFQSLEKLTYDVGHLHQLAAHVVLCVLAGQPDAARRAGEQALPLFEARLRERPNDASVMMELSWVYLALGRNADALRVSRQAADSISIEKDALMGPSYRMGLAQIEARAGAPDEAIKTLRRLLSIPAGHVASITRLKIDPVWDPIRSRPDFQQLLSGQEQIGPNKDDNRGF